MVQRDVATIGIHPGNRKSRKAGTLRRKDLINNRGLINGVEGRDPVPI